VADASHELRTPLASLKAELELALNRPRSVPELEQACATRDPGSQRASSPAFDRFSRADKERSSRGGAGLGLAIADLIARAHGGYAEARNAQPGADVFLVLPRSRPGA
jgi:signal transduction histidine kinase